MIAVSDGEHKARVQDKKVVMTDDLIPDKFRTQATQLP